jgi:hypothetical protein
LHFYGSDPQAQTDLKTSDKAFQKTVFFVIACERMVLLAHLLHGGKRKGFFENPI